MESYIVIKPLNNNVVFAKTSDEREVVLVGKGIGFNRKAGTVLDASDSVAKVFVLDQGTEQYKQLLLETDEQIMGVCEEFIYYVSQQLKDHLNEHIHIALTDHLAFAIKRLKQGMIIENPFAHEIQALYPEEYALAEKGAVFVEEELGIVLPVGELCFIALHLHSARMNKDIGKSQKAAALISKLVAIIEAELAIEINRHSIDYSRLITHLRYAIERTVSQQALKEQHPLAALLKKQFPLCYNLAWKLVKVLENDLMKTVPEAEISYLTIHLQRIVAQDTDDSH